MLRQRHCVLACGLAAALFFGCPASEVVQAGGPGFHGGGGWHGGPHGYYPGHYGHGGYGWGGGIGIGIGIDLTPGYYYPPPAYAVGYPVAVPVPVAAPSPGSTLPLSPAPQPAPPASPELAPPPKPLDTGADSAAHLRVAVPADAEVWIEGQPTTQGGATRLFRSAPLSPGKEYTYEVRARWTEENGPVERLRTLTIHAGEQVNVSFVPANGTAGR